MEAIAKLKSIWEKNRKTIIITVCSVLAALFVGSLLLAIFIGGEFNQKDDAVSYDVKGILTIVDGDYETDYTEGSQFEFNKEQSVIQIKVKDLILNETYSRELEADEYGFLINGEGDLCVDPAEITMNKDIKFIRVVWVEYQHIKADIAVNVKDKVQ